MPDRRVDRPDRLRQLGGVGDLERPEHCRLRPLHRQPRCARTTAATATSRSSSATTRARSDIVAADVRRDLAGVQQLRRQQPLHVHGRVPARATRTATRRRTRSRTTARSRRPAAVVVALGRVPDDPLPRGQRLQPELHLERRHAARAATCSPTTRPSSPAATTSTGRGAQRDNVEAARDAGVSLAFFSGNEVFWKTRWADSALGTDRPNRTLISYKDTHFQAATDPVDVDRHVARPALRRAARDDRRRTRSPAPRSSSTPARRRSRCRGPTRTCGCGATRPSRASPPARARCWRLRRSATSGTRIPTTASAPPASSGSPRPRSRGVEIFTDHGTWTDDRHGDAQPRRCTGGRAARSCSAPAPCSGPGASTAANPIGNAPEHDDAPGDAEPVRRHGRAAATQPIAGLTRATKTTDTTAPTATDHVARLRRDRHGRHAGDRQRHGQPTAAAASSPASRCRPTAARRGTRRPARRAGRTPGTRTAPRPPTCACAPSTTAATCRRRGAGINVNVVLPVLDLGRPGHARAGRRAATPARSSSA